jgi:hypothetical protein
VGGTPQLFAPMPEPDRAKWKMIVTERHVTAEQ